MPARLYELPLSALSSIGGGTTSNEGAEITDINRAWGLF